MTSRIMRSCAAALVAMAATISTAHAGNADRCPLEPGSEGRYLSPDESFMAAAGARTMLVRVLSVVAVNTGDLVAELAFEGPLAGPPGQRHAELMSSVARELGLVEAPEARSGPASAR